MATPETLSVELDPFGPSFDEDLDAVECEENQMQAVEADTRELSAYSFDSDDKTLVGIGTSGAADSSPVLHFDSSDRTLVGIGCAERAESAERAELAELASHSQQAESAPESDFMPPQSEAPGPFVAGDDDDAPDRLPMQKGQPWLLALSAALVAAATFALLRGVAPHTTAPRLHSATTAAQLSLANETQTRSGQFETVAANAVQASAVEVPTAQASETTQASEAYLPEALPAIAPREQAPRRVTKKSAGTEPLGALDVSSNSNSGLVLDGRPLGKAPRVIQLPSGPHTVLFVHPERGRMSVTVNVRAGRTTVASADF